MFSFKSKYAPFTLVAFLALSFSTAQETGEKEPYNDQRNLRRQKLDVSSSSASSASDSLDSSSASSDNDPVPRSQQNAMSPLHADEVKRVVVKCKAGEDHEKCLEKVRVSSGQSVKIVHDLKGTNSVAISITGLQIDELMQEGIDLQEDPIRLPLYIKESIQHHGRELAQATPYGFTM
jgi:hypothetical protein